MTVDTPHDISCVALCFTFVLYDASFTVFVNLLG